MSTYSLYAGLLFVHLLQLDITLRVGMDIRQGTCQGEVTGTLRRLDEQLQRLEEGVEGSVGIRRV